MLCGGLLIIQFKAISQTKNLTKSSLYKEPTDPTSNIEKYNYANDNTTRFTIYFKDDPNTQYEYRYFLYSNVYLNPRKNNYNKMFCFAYDMKLKKEKNMYDNHNYLARKPFADYIKYKKCLNTWK